MERALFASHFRGACLQTLENARAVVEETLPAELRFRVRLAGAYTGRPRPKNSGRRVSDVFRGFPEDACPRLAQRLSCCTEEAAIDALWRNGWVPHWVNVSVIGEGGTYTLVELLCAGRFTQDEEKLYHQNTGFAPFQIGGAVSPRMSFRESRPRRFSIYHEADCWTPEELRRAGKHAGKVQTLRLHGPAFDDDCLASISDFEELAHLHVDLSPLRGPGLVGLKRQRNLRHLRVSLVQAAHFDAAAFPELPQLQTLGVENLPAGARNLSSLVERAPNVESFTLHAEGELVLDRCSMRSGMRVVLTATRLSGRPLPSRLDSLGLHLSQATEAEVAALVESVESLSALSLRGTPVGDELVEALVARLNPKRLRVENTAMSERMMEKLRR